jgi:hypothetical protein
MFLNGFHVDCCIYIYIYITFCIFLISCCISSLLVCNSLYYNDINITIIQIAFGFCHGIIEILFFFEVIVSSYSCVQNSEAESFITKGFQNRLLQWKE